MSLDFWNNPLVVSAFRVNYRRSSPFRILTMHILLLAVGASVLNYYQAQIKLPWPKLFYLIMMAGQCLISIIGAVSATQTSLRSEVSQRTLDFQRIAALSPRQILLGKLLGEPAMAYLLPVATIPFSVMSWVLGGVAFEVVVLMYINLATTIVMAGALGLIQRLDAPAGKVKGGGSWGTPFLMFLVIIALVNLTPIFLVAGGGAFSKPWSAALLGLFIPLPSFYGVCMDQPWLYGLAFFGLEIPFFFVTPFVQLGLAYICFQTMERQLINPMYPQFSKKTAYVLLMIVDLLAAGVLYDTGPTGLEAGPRGTAFCLVHLVVSLWLVMAVSPWRETLWSWIWRFQGKMPLARDLWLGDRSENILALLTFCGIGLLNLVLLVLLPMIKSEAGDQVLDAANVLLSAAAVTVVLILALGAFHQQIIFLAGRGGGGLMISLLLVVTAAPHIAGAYYRLDWLMALAPTYHFGMWFHISLEGPKAAALGLDYPVPVLPMLFLYLLLFIVSRVALNGMMRLAKEKVHHKLARMGVAGFSARPALEPNE